MHRRALFVALLLLLGSPFASRAVDTADVHLIGRVWRVDQYVGPTGLERTLVWVRTEGTTSNLKVFPVQCIAPAEAPCLAPDDNLFSCSVQIGVYRWLRSGSIIAGTILSTSCADPALFGRCVGVSGYLFNGSVDPIKDQVLVIGEKIEPLAGVDCSEPQSP